VDADGFAIRDDAELVAAGWERRFLADPDRAREATELYTSLGYEVLAHELTPDEFGPMCAQCPASACLSYVMIYTRPRPS
jgi:hypothetical protein